LLKNIAISDAPNLTENGLIIKGHAKIEAIITEGDQRVVTAIRTWHCSRLLRRDFNFLTANMYWACRDHSKRRQIRDRMFDIVDEAYAIGRGFIDGDRSDDIHSTLTIRVVSAEAMELYESIMLVDRSLSRMVKIESPEVATKECAEYFSKIKRLKHLFC
jgi:hypothetical protein